MYRILVIEDDKTIRDELYTLLISDGYEPVSEPPCDLALLDINLPGESGFDICQKLRKTYHIPIIFLTARESPQDELFGFAVGADDYIKKPYNPAVLLARIAPLIRRSTPQCLNAKGLTLNLTNLTACYDGKSIELTKNEARVLACLMKKELCTRNDIIEDLWNNSLYVDENTLYVNISRLREKLKGLGAGHLIMTVRGVGYKL